jgi:hypothetical protein
MHANMMGSHETRFGIDGVRLQPSNVVGSIDAR